MTQPWLSLAGLIEEDPTVLDNLQLPTAADYADISDLVVDHPFVPSAVVFTNYLLMQTAELPLVYTDPKIVKLFVGYWSAAQMPAWVELYRTLLYKYNPIWNKDGKITERRDTAFNETGSTTDTGTVTTDQDTSDTGTVRRAGSSSGSTEHQVTGFDSNTYSPDTRDLTSGSADETTTNNLAGTNDVTVTNNLAGSSAKGGTAFDVFERTETGNIGVTTTQAMIAEQRKIAEFNFYDYLVAAFKKEFCVRIW